MEEMNTTMTTNEVTTGAVTITQMPPTRSGVKAKFDCKSALIGGAAGAVAGIVGKIIFDKVRARRLAEYETEYEEEDYKEVDED